MEIDENDGENGGEFGDSVIVEGGGVGENEGELGENVIGDGVGVGWGVRMEDGGVIGIMHGSAQAQPIGDGDRLEFGVTGGVGVDGDMADDDIDGDGGCRLRPMGRLVCVGLTTLSAAWE